MAQYPKFEPLVTPKANYDQGAINWSFITMIYPTPVGPKVSNYDPYYRYSVNVNMAGQLVRQTWFASVDDHKAVQLTGATKGTTIAVTAVQEGKRKGIVAVHSQGPVEPRTPQQVEAEIAQGLAALNPSEQLLPPQPPQFPQPTGAPQPPTAPQAPQAPQPPTAPQAPQAPQAVAPPAPPKQAAPPKAPPPPSKPSVIDPANTNGSYTHIPMTDDEFEAYKGLWQDNARCIVWAYGQILGIAKDLDVKVTPANVRELATSASIETFRQLGRGRSPLHGAQTLEAFASELGGVVTENGKVKVPTGAETKNGALELIAKLDLANYNDPKTAIVDWLKYTAEPTDGIKAWQHAGAIVALLGIDRQVLIDEWDVDNLMNLTTAVWTYQGARDDGLSRYEAQQLVSKEHGIPLESMVIEDEDEDEEQDE